MVRGGGNCRGGGCSGGGCSGGACTWLKKPLRLSCAPITCTPVTCTPITCDPFYTTRECSTSAKVCRLWKPIKLVCKGKKTVCVGGGCTTRLRQRLLAGMDSDTDNMLALPAPANATAADE